MPKQKFEITTFSKGVIGSASETDIPHDAASYSLNINPNSEDGTLRPINEDQALSVGTGWSKVLPHMESLRFPKTATTTTVITPTATNTESTLYPGHPKLTVNVMHHIDKRDGDYIIFTGAGGSAQTAYDFDGTPQKIAIEDTYNVVLLDVVYDSGTVTSGSYTIQEGYSDDSTPIFNYASEFFRIHIVTGEDTNGLFYLWFSQKSVTNLVTNGTMEADSNWNNTASAPATNERSDTEKHGGTYSRKFIPNAANEGIVSDTFTTVINKTYRLEAWVRPSTSAITITFKEGNGSTTHTRSITGLTSASFNKITEDFTDVSGGSSASIQFDSGTFTSGTFYIDDVVINELRGVDRNKDLDDMSQYTAIEVSIYDNDSPTAICTLAETAVDDAFNQDELRPAHNETYTNQDATQIVVPAGTLYLEHRKDGETDGAIIESGDSDGFGIDSDVVIKSVSQTGHGSSFPVNDFVAINEEFKEHDLPDNDGDTVMRNDVFTLIGVDFSNNKIYKWDDIYKTDGNPNAEQSALEEMATGLSHDNVSTFTVRNKNVHIGLGASITAKTKWVGKIDNAQLNNVYNDWYVENDELGGLSENLSPVNYDLIVTMPSWGNSDGTHVSHAFAENQTHHYSLEILDGTGSGSGNNEATLNYFLNQASAAYSVGAVDNEDTGGLNLYGKVINSAPGIGWIFNVLSGTDLGDGKLLAAKKWAYDDGAVLAAGDKFMVVDAGANADGTGTDAVVEFIAEGNSSPFAYGLTEGSNVISKITMTDSTDTNAFTADSEVVASKRYTDYDLTGILDDSGISTMTPCRSVLTSGNTISNSGYMNYGDGTADHNHIADQRSRPLWGMWWISTQAGRLYRVNLMDIDSKHHDETYKGPKLDCEMTFDYSQIGMCQDNVDSGVFKHWYGAIYGVTEAVSGTGHGDVDTGDFSAEDWTAGYTWNSSPANSKIIGIIETSNSCTDPGNPAAVSNQAYSDAYVFDDDSRNTGDGLNQYGDGASPAGYMNHHHAERTGTSTKESFTHDKLINVKYPWHGQDVGSILTMYTASTDVTATNDEGIVANNGNTIVNRLTGHMSFRCIGQYAADAGSRTMYHSTKVWVLFQNKDQAPYTKWNLMLYNFYPSTVGTDNVALVYDRTPPYDEVDIGTRSGASSYDSWYKNGLSSSQQDGAIVAQKSSMFHQGNSNWSQHGSYNDTNNHSTDDPKKHVITRRDGAAIYWATNAHLLQQSFFGRILGFDGSTETNNPRTIYPLNHSLYHILEPVDTPLSLGVLHDDTAWKDATYEDDAGRYNGARLKMFGNKHQVGFLARVNGRLCMDGLATYYRRHEHHSHVDSHSAQFKTYNNSLVSFTVTDTGAAYNDARTYNASYDYYQSSDGEPVRYVAHNQNAHYSDGGRFKKRAHWVGGTLKYLRGSEISQLFKEGSKYSSYNGTVLSSKTIPHLNTQGRAHNSGTVFHGQVGDFLYIDRKWISCEPCTGDGTTNGAVHYVNEEKNQGIWQSPDGIKQFESRGDSGTKQYHFTHANARPFVASQLSKRVRTINGSWFGSHNEGHNNQSNERPVDGQSINSGGMNPASKQMQPTTRMGAWNDTLMEGATPTGYGSTTDQTTFDMNRWTPSFEIMQQDVVETRVIQEVQGQLAKVRSAHHIYNKYLRSTVEGAGTLVAYTGSGNKTGRNNCLFIQGAKIGGNEFQTIFDLTSLHYPILVDLDSHYPDPALKSTAYSRSTIAKTYQDAPKLVTTFHGGNWNKDTNQENDLFGSGTSQNNQFLAPFADGLDLNNNSNNAVWNNLADITDYTKFDQLVTVTAENSGSVTNFKVGQNIKYKVGFVYDGYQDGPLSNFAFDRDIGTNCESLTVEVKLNAEGSISKRVTHLTIFRKKSDNELYRLVKQIPLSIEEWSFSEEYNSWSHIFTDSRVFASWSAITGISEDVQDFSLNYSLSAEINDHLFVSGAWHSKIEDASKYIFRSKPGNFSQFDYTKDYLILPSRPTALASYNGKIYAFDRGNTYRINPEQMVIEDSFEGIGCLSQDSFVVTDYGMCFADINNIYIHDGAKPIPIGDNILSVSTYEGWDVGWKNAVKKSEETYRYSPFVFFDGDSNSFVCFIIGSCEQNCNPKVTRVWAYSITRNRWDLWEGPTARKATQGKDGDVLISDRTILYNYKKDSSFRKWKWLSKKLSISKGLSTKRFHRIKLLGSPVSSVFGNPVVNWHDDSVVVWVDGKEQPITREDKHYTISFTGSWLYNDINDSDTELDVSGLNAKRSFGLNLKHAIGTYLKLDDEIMLLTGVVDLENSSTLTVTRAQMGTTAAAHTNSTSGPDSGLTGEGYEGSRLFYVAPSLKLPKKCKGKNIEIQIQNQTAVVDSFQIEFIEKSGR